MQIGVIATTEETIFLDKEKQAKWLVINKAADLEKAEGIIFLSENDLVLEGKLVELGLIDVLSEKIQRGAPLWAMGASFLLLGRKKKNYFFEMLALEGAKTSYPQKFPAEIYVPTLGTEKIKVKFYQTPWIEKVESHVGIMAKYQEKIVMVRQGNILASVFSPYREEKKIFDYFLNMVKENMDNL